MKGWLPRDRRPWRGAGDVRIGAIGVAALGPAPLLVDAALAPLTKAPLFGLDRRAEPQRRRMTRGLAAEEAAGTLDNALPKLAWWLDNEPAVSARAAWALDATGFLVASLTGVPVMDTVTAGDYALPGVESAVPASRPGRPAGGGGRASGRRGRSAWVSRPGCRWCAAPTTPSSTSPPRACAGRATPEWSSAAR